MGVFKEQVIEREDFIFQELDRLQKSFFEMTGAEHVPVLEFSLEENSFEPDAFTLTLPSFHLAHVS